MQSMHGAGIRCSVVDRMPSVNHCMLKCVVLWPISSWIGSPRQDRDDFLVFARASSIDIEEFAFDVIVDCYIQCYRSISDALNCVDQLMRSSLAMSYTQAAPTNSRPNTSH